MNKLSWYVLADLPVPLMLMIAIIVCLLFKGEDTCITQSH
jgi:hypothetical protein